jgi:LAO/AO transport system ATPase
VLDDLCERFRQGDRLALSRLLSLAARGQASAAIETLVNSKSSASRVVAITGSAGVGKSSLVGKLIDYYRQQGPKVAVLACDPQSPISGGALLGDRFRMPSRTNDDGTFIRSLAAPGGQGTAAPRIGTLIQLLEAFGFEIVLLETVGAGQGDTAVRALVDVFVLLLQPETGDDIQWEKAGLLEVADLVVIHKADLPGAERLESQVRMALALSAGEPAPIFLISSKTGEGIAELANAILSRPLRRKSAECEDRDLLRLAQEALADRFERATGAGDPAIGEILKRWRSGQVKGASASVELLQILASLGGDGNSTH